MSSSASRGAVLVAVAAVLVFLVLRGAADNSQFPVETGAPEPTPTVVVELEAAPEDTVEVGAETLEVDPSTARDNSEVSVLVANGTTVTGQASRLTSQLRNQGFMTREPRTATVQTASTIYYRPGFAAEATVVRNVLGVATPIAPLPETDLDIGDGIDLAPVDVLVLIGADDLSQS